MKYRIKYKFRSKISQIKLFFLKMPFKNEEGAFENNEVK